MVINYDTTVIFVPRSRRRRIWW